MQEAIKRRGLKHELEGKALTKPFLTEMERQYKNKYLRDISSHAELLVYDWTGGGEVEVVSKKIDHNLIRYKKISNILIFWKRLRNIICISKIPIGNIIQWP